MTLEYCDPYSKMRVARTYFTTTNCKSYHKLNEVYDSEISVAGD